MSPMLVISSTNETNERDRGKGYLHELKDQEGVMESICAYSETVERVNDIPAAIADAFQYLETNRPRPVHIQVPTDVMGRSDRVATADRPASPVVPEVDTDRLDDAADRFTAADRPLLVVGGGATGAASAIRELVDLTGVPVLSTVAGKGVVPERHDCALGARTSNEEVREFVADCDFSLAIGTELSPLDTRDIDLPENLVHVDIDYATIGRNYPADLAIVGDAEAAVSGLLDRLDGRDVVVDDMVTDRVASIREGYAWPDPGSDDDRHVILAALEDALDENALIVGDMTKLCYEGRRVLPMSEPGSFLFPRGYGTLGFSPPTAFGAAVGQPDRQIVALVGDGGFMFTVQALANAVKYDLSVPVVVSNDEAYGIIGDVQRRDYGRTVGDDIVNPDFVAMAESFGAAAERIDPDNVVSELPAALADAFERDGPTLIDLPVDFE